MKLSTAFLLIATAATASAHAIRNPSAKAKLLSKARRLEDQNQEGDDAAAQEEEDEFQFLQNYSLKMIGCAAEQYKNPEDGEYEYSSVVFRLCPSDACDDESATGCSSGHGDYVVGINSFVEAWLEDKREDMENDQDDQWDMNQFSECREYEVDQDADDEDADEEEGQGYYVGPTCDSTTGTIKIGFFSEYTCTTVPNGVSFEDISNGWSLPYSDGGLVTKYCESCAGYNDNGEFELSEMCTQLYQGASSKCEGGMEYYSQYGKDDSGCEYIAQSFPATVAKKGGAGIIFLWIILGLVLAGALFFVYTKWWMKRKQGSTAGLSSSDGVAA